MSLAPVNITGNTEDIDLDSLSDQWEQQYFGNLDFGTDEDTDQDGLINLEEFQSGTNPANADSDGDGMDDGYEAQYAADSSNASSGSEWSNGEELDSAPAFEETDAVITSESDGLDNSAIESAGEDSDGDGMPDDWEITYGLNPNLNDAQGDLDGEGLSNFAEFQAGTNPADADSDYDGRSDSQEVTENTNPLDANSALQMRLSQWRLNDGNLLGERNQTPKTSQNNVLAPSWRGQGLDVTASTNSKLLYKDVEANGTANINLKKGSIRFWIKPSWSSTTAGGTGPQTSWARMIEVGSWTSGATYGAWILHFNPEGTEMRFNRQNNVGGNQTLTTSPFSWTAGQWHQVVLTYSGLQTKIYVDGQVIGTGTGISVIPSAAIRAGGFSIGTDRGGNQRTQCVMDEVEYFNYELSAAQIQQDYTAAAAFGSDGDGDQMPDSWEVANGLNPNLDDSQGDLDGDGLSNLGEFQQGTNPLDSDSDYDGRSDSQELVENTNPLDANSVTAVRLSQWRLNDANLLGERNQSPKTSQNNILAAAWRGQGLDVPASTDSKLLYKDVESNGTANINLKKGSIRVWIKPSWSSTPQGGTGPQTWGRILEVGSWTSGATYGYWGLIFEPGGNDIRFGSQNNTGQGATVFIKPISWTAGQWHQIVLTYSASQTKLFIDGQDVATGAGIAYLPPAAIRALGFSIGTDRNGTQRSQCIVDEVECFNYQLSAAQIQQDYAAAVAFGPDGDGDQIPDSWEVANGLNSNLDDSQGDLDGEGLTNLQEYTLGTNPADADSDYDGANDFQEVQASTNPLNASSASQMRLSQWRLSDANLLGERNQPPKTSQNNVLAAAWRGQGLDVTASTNSKLLYKDVESNGIANINLKKGSIRIWIKPSWSSTTQGGSGPQTWGRIIEVGSWTSNASYGWWGLILEPGGNDIRFGSQNNTNQGATTFIKPISWIAGQWHQVVLTYSGSQTKLYLDGQNVATGAGIAYLPPAAIRALGFSIGSDRSGTQRTNCIIDEVECFNYELSATQIQQDYVTTVALGVDTDGDELPDTWESQSSGGPLTLLNGNGISDADGDGLSDLTEYQIGWNPTSNNINNAAQTESLTYDAAQRLLNVTGHSALGYTPDAGGNLTQTTSP